MIPEELLQHKLLRNYIPGTGRISKFVAKNQFTIGLITASLLSVPTGTYRTGRQHVYRCLVGIQHTMTHEFMCRAIQYCLNVYKRFHIFPILHIVFTSKMGSKALSELFKFAQDRSYLLERPYCHFATNCFMLTKQSINPFIGSLISFSHFLTTGQQSVISIDRWDDPTVTKLYLVAMEMVKKDRETENDKLEVQATQIQFEKILSTIFDNPKQAQRYADAGLHYSASLKRKYDIMKQESSNTPPETTTPMELPRDFDSPSCSINSKNKKLVAFVDTWKQNNNGRMN